MLTRNLLKTSLSIQSHINMKQIITDVVMEMTSRNKHSIPKINYKSVTKVRLLEENVKEYNVLSIVV